MALLGSSPASTSDSDLSFPTNGTHEAYHRPSDSVLSNGKRTMANGNVGTSEPALRVVHDHPPSPEWKSRTLLETFLQFHAELEKYRSGETIVIDGQSLSLPAIVAAARFPFPSCTDSSKPETAQVILSDDKSVRSRVERSRQLIDSKLDAGKSIYGISTGFGGSADIRTSSHLSLGLALLQHQHVGILPSSVQSLTHTIFDATDASPLPLLPPLSTSMPPSWVRGATIVRANTLIRGHSGVRWMLVESMIKMLNKNIVPIVPLRGSVSASGDLSPLSYIAGALMGYSNIFVNCTVPAPVKPLADSTPSPRQIIPSSEALNLHGLEPLVLLPKEHLGMINGTSFSASVAAMVAFESVGAIVLGEICTAMGTEALLGTQGNFAAFISEARPHPGQMEASSTLHALLTGSSLAHLPKPRIDEVTIDEDAGELRQDRYSLRTAPQWIGPLIEDVMSAVRSVEIECNSTTDNPLVDPANLQVHHGGNFQALALTTAFEKTRLALFLLGKLLFSQSTELLHPAFNRGLPPSVAATDPSLNYHAKGLDIAMASYVSELGWLTSNVGTHVQSAEMHNQAVNSLALIAGRATLSALEVLNMLIASYLYILCQALDLRALQNHYNTALSILLTEELGAHLSTVIPSSLIPSMHSQVLPAILASLDSTTSMDALPRLESAASASTGPIMEFLASTSCSDHVAGDLIGCIKAFRASFSKRGAQILQDLRESFVSGTPPPPSSLTSAYNPLAPAASFLGRTRPVYEYIRIKLGVRTHGLENWNNFQEPLGSLESQPGIGRNISLIYEAIRDGEIHSIVAGIFQK